MRKDQEFTPKYWVGHHKKEDDVIWLSMSKSRDQCIEWMDECFGDDWFLDDDYEIILIEIKQVPL